MSEAPDTLRRSLEELQELTKKTFLPELRKATAELVPFSQVVSKSAAECTECIELNCNSGHGLIFGLYKNTHVAMARCFLSSGALIPHHLHGEREIMGVLEGQLIIKIGDKEVTVCQYESIDIPPDVPHTVLATSDTWSWIVTMPASEEFPDGPSK